MRLTDVTQMALPPGRLWSLSLAPVASGRRLPVSFDQARHVGAGDRASSWLAIALRLPAPVERDRLAQAWLALVARHGSLGTVFTPAGPPGTRPALHEVVLDDPTWVEHEVPEDTTTRAVLRSVLDATCRPFAGPSHRLCLVQPDTGRPALVVATDHAHADQWSLLVLARDLLDVLAGTRPEPPQVLAFAAHTAELEARPAAPAHVRARWDEVLASSGGVMPRFPLPLGDLTHPRPGVVEVRDVLDGPALAALTAQAGRLGTRVLPLVVSAMVGATAELAGAPLRAVFPVHSRHHERWHDSVGWFITNAVLEADDPDPHACASAVARAVELGSWPLADVLASYGGMPEAPGMFAISWLDAGRLPVGLDPALDLEPQLVSAAVDADGVMVWFLLDARGMHLRCRYPDTAQARSSLGRWLDALEGRVRGLASAGGHAPDRAGWSS